ncbi:hypothetical protein DID88_004323 [Monilinia fructigena]|uniref:Dienelactone hydrolase domain-containing protein n=1 Tax=Monilinia fructigena TaxID=38457 RepID=A0A395ISG6_9HELO|nr:hypothetical protein DID88_004323 [Monilinia fructigena]
MSSCCLSGKVHESTPTGKVEIIDDLSTYIAEPQDGSKAKTIIFLVDIFGYECKNVRLLADNYAKAGFYVCIPDIHQGNSLPLSFLQSFEPPLPTRNQQSLMEKTKATGIVSTTLSPWLIQHREGIAKLLISSFISHIRGLPGVAKNRCLGFLLGRSLCDISCAWRGGCGGGVLSVIDIGAGGFRGGSKTIEFGGGDQDSLLDQGTVEQIRGVLERRVGVPHEVRVYEDQVHGFLR